MKKKLIKRDIIICVSIAFVLYGLYVLLGYRFGWIGMEADLTLNVVFPVLAFGFMWFLAGRSGPWWALPALLFCLLVEMFCQVLHMFERNWAFDLHLLWVWMDGPKLWWPIVGYGIGILIYSIPREKVPLWISVVFGLYGLFLLSMRFFGAAVFAGTHGWLIFPAAALLYMCFFAQRFGPLWAFPVLLLCMLVENLIVNSDIDITILWSWVDGPTLYGPIVGYVIGCLIYGAVALVRAEFKHSAQ